MPDTMTISLLHFGFIAFWGGVIAAEAVLELYPFRNRDHHEQAIVSHYWIDLLVELPIICGVVLTGILLVFLTWPPSALHWVKLACATGSVSANIVCIALVLRRKRLFISGAPEEKLWTDTRRIILSAKIGIPLGITAAGMGLWLSRLRLLELFAG